MTLATRSLAVEGVAADGEAFHLVVGDLDPERIAVLVEVGSYGEAGAGGGRRDQLDDHLVADEGPAAPVLRDVAKLSWSTPCWTTP